MGNPRPRRLRWTPGALEQYRLLEAHAARIATKRKKTGKRKTSRQEGLFAQVQKALRWLRTNPRHPGLRTHEYESLPHPFDPKERVFEAYAQQKTPGAYRIFWCYGPHRGELTIIAITPHP